MVEKYNIQDGEIKNIEISLKNTIESSIAELNSSISSMNIRVNELSEQEKVERLKI